MYGEADLMRLLASLGSVFSALLHPFFLSHRFRRCLVWLAQHSCRMRALYRFYLTSAVLARLLCVYGMLGGKKLTIMCVWMGNVMMPSWIPFPDAFGA